MSKINERVSDFGEIRLLSEILLKDVTGNEEEKSDDCVHLGVSDESLLWSIDPCPTPVANWFNLATPDVWGCYTATINLSDIAASGGTPIGMLISLEMPDDTLISSVKEFQSGLMSTLKNADTSLLGGNIKSASKFSSTGTIIGSSGDNKVTRFINVNTCSVYLVGKSGSFWSAVIGNHYGWSNVSDKTQAQLNAALCFPEAQTEAGKILGKLPFEVACMDCSDGPANALYQLAKNNLLDFNVNSNLIDSLSNECIQLLEKNDINTENACYQFGDWQLLCVIPKNECENFEKALKEFDVNNIAEAVKGRGAVTHEDGRELAESSLNQNFSGGYNSIKNIDDLISQFMHTPIFE